MPTVASRTIHLGPLLVFLTAVALAGTQNFKPLLPYREQLRFLKDKA